MAGYIGSAPEEDGKPSLPIHCQSLSGGYGTRAYQGTYVDLPQGIRECGGGEQLLEGYLATMKHFQ